VRKQNIKIWPQNRTYLSHSFAQTPNFNAYSAVHLHHWSAGSLCQTAAGHLALLPGPGHWGEMIYSQQTAQTLKSNINTPHKSFTTVKQLCYRHNWPELEHEEETDADEKGVIFCELKRKTLSRRWGIRMLWDMTTYWGCTKTAGQNWRVAQRFYWTYSDCLKELTKS
jgi:hypothetical protein